MPIYTCKILNNLPHVITEGSSTSLDRDFITGDFTPGTVFSSMALQPGTGLGTTLFINTEAVSNQLAVFGAPTNYVVNEWVGVKLDTDQWWWSIITNVNNAGGVVTIRDAVPSQASAGSQVVAQHQAEGATAWTAIQDFKYPKYVEILNNTQYLNTAEIPYDNYIFVPSSTLIADVGSFQASSRIPDNFDVVDATGRTYQFSDENDFQDFTYTISGYRDNLLKGQNTLLQSLWAALNTASAVDAIVDNRSATPPTLSAPGFPFVRFASSDQNELYLTSTGTLEDTKIGINSSSNQSKIRLLYSEQTDTASLNSLVDMSIAAAGNLEVAADTLTLDSASSTNEVVKFSSDGAGDFSVFTSNGSPEGVVTAGLGDLCIDTTNGIQYTKVSGSNTNSGWLAGGGPAIIMFGNSMIQANTNTRYLTPGYATNNAQTSPIRYPCVRDGIISGMNIAVQSGSGNGNNVVYTLRVNEAATSLSITLASTSTDGSSSAIVPVSRGDILDIEVTKEAAIGNSPDEIIATLSIF